MELKFTEAARALPKDIFRAFSFGMEDLKSCDIDIIASYRAAPYTCSADIF